MKQAVTGVGWQGLSERIRKHEEDGSPKSEPWKFCTCRLPDSDWSFGGWHMCLDRMGNESAYERCPEFYIHHRKKLGDGRELAYEMIPGEPHKVRPIVTSAPIVDSDRGILE